MTADRVQRILGRDLRAGWKGLALGIVAILLLAGVIHWGTSEFDPPSYTFADGTSTSGGTPREVRVTQDGSMLQATMHIDGLPSTPAPAVRYGIALDPGSRERVEHASAIAEPSDDGMAYRLYNRSRNQIANWDELVTENSGTYSETTGPVREVIGQRSFLPPRVTVHLEHSTGPQGVDDLGIELVAGDEVLARSDDDPGESGIEETVWEVPSERRDDDLELELRVFGAEANDKLNSDVDYNFTARLRYDLVEADEPDILQNLTGAYDPAAGQVRIEIPSSALFEDGSRQHLGYSGFVTEDSELAAGSLRGSGGRLRLAYTSATYGFVGRVLTPLFGMATLIALLAFGISTFLVYGREISKGTVRSLVQYPLSYNRIHVTKAVSALIPGAIALLVFGGTALPPIASGASVAPDWTPRLVASVLAGVGTTVGLLAVWAYGASSLAARTTGRMVLGFHRAFLAFFVGSIVLTEWMFDFLFLRLLAGANIIKTSEQAQAFTDLASYLAQFSPVHVGGRVAAVSAGADLGLDLHIVGPIAIALGVLGTMAGYRLYPDVLLSETTS